MKDKTIINIISKIHSFLINALSLIFVTLSVLILLLLNGVYLNNVSLPNLHIKNLHIKWNKKLNVIVDEITVKKETDPNKPPVELEDIKKLLKYIKLFDHWFEKIRVDKIHFNDMSGSFKYLDGDSGLFTLHSADFDLKSSLAFSSKYLNLNIESLKDAKRDININGNLIFDTSGEIELTSLLNINIGNNSPFKLYSIGDMNGLSYSIEATDEIKDIKKIIDMFSFDPDIKYWFYDAMDLSGVSIENLHGWVKYNKSKDAYKNITIKASANNLIYKYDKKLEPIYTSKTDIELKHGVLYIRPQDAYTYNFFLDKSWLKIDFSKKEELLSLYLLFKGQANQDVLNLLNNYKINLPIMQTKGELDVDLKLDINLRTTDVKAIGNFQTKNAQIRYQGLDIDVFDVNVSLNNSIVKAKNIFAKYQDIASSYLDIDFNTQESKGYLNFKVNKLLFSEIDLELQNNKAPLNILYSISPKQEILKVNESVWKFKNNLIKLSSMQTLVDAKNLKIKIPKSSVESSGFLSASASGVLSLKPLRADIDIDLMKFNYESIRLDQSSLPIKFIYDNNFTFSSNSNINLIVADKKCSLKSAKLNINDGLLQIRNIQLSVDELIKSSLNVQYNTKTSTGTADMYNVAFVDDKLKEIFKRDKSIKLNIESKNNRTIINSKDYDIDYLMSQNRWDLKLKSIDKLAKNSEFLKKYNITNGNINFYKKDDEENINFSAHTNYKYKILVNGDSPVESYSVFGKIDGKTKDIALSVNNSVDVLIGDSIDIKAKNIGVNLDELVSLLKDINKDNVINGATSNVTNKKDDTKELYFDAINSNIYLSKNRHVVSDTIKLNYLNKILIAKLTHKKGSADFKFYDNKFTLNGKDFDDEFVEKISYLSKFSGGVFGFSISGSFDEYIGLIEAKDTIIKDHKVLNNVLAFVNTIPSLITFSLPGYNRSGFNASSAYIDFKYKDDIYKIDDISVTSKEITIVGLGEASIKNNSVNLDLNLKTDLGSSIAKIPVVGYILLGNNAISTSLKVTGALNDPKVDTQIAKDIAVAPLNIIKRTLMYPFELFKKDK